MQMSSCSIVADVRRLAGCRQNCGKNWGQLCERKLTEITAGKNQKTHDFYNDNYFMNIETASLDSSV